MDLWRGSVDEFIRHAGTRALAGELTGNFVRLHGQLPGAGELRSWEESLPRMADAVRPLRRRDMGVALGTPVSSTTRGGGEGVVAEGGGGSASVMLEYHLPLTGRRVDVMFTGRDARQEAWAVVVELKQWSEVTLEDEHATNVRAAGSEHVHPSEQAADYADWMASYHSAFTRDGMRVASLSYLHNLTADGAGALRDARFDELLRRSPAFLRGEEEALLAGLESRVGAGGGAALLERLVSSSFRPGPRVLENLQAVIDREEQWHLLDEQRLAFNAILAEVRRQRSRGGRSAVIVRGAPGTGKTVIAVQLLAATLDLRWKAAHTTGGKAFTTALRSRFKGADGLFLWNHDLRKSPTQGLDLLLVDEAHRVRETSDNRWTPAAERGGKSQARELLDASRVVVFLLDENQSVRPDEVGSTEVIAREMKAARATVRTFDLRTQFRCGGCVEYVDWVDRLLGFGEAAPQPWGGAYDVTVADDPAELEAVIEESRAAGRTARMVAGFCWKWSDPAPDGSLVGDVVIGGWRRPWNRKEGKRKYKPAQHPYTLWAQTAEGEGQVGCIYSAQGFEFHRIGLIWGNDLVRRGDRWVAQPEASFDRPVRSSPDMLRLVRNAYRVLLTRGTEGARLLILDGETRRYVEESLRGMGEPRTSGRDAG